MCRFCNKPLETIDHLVSGCSILTPSVYKNRHHRVSRYLHWKICTNFSVATTKNWYEHKPEPATEGPGFNILWDFPIHTDRTTQTNRPDIMLKNRVENTCYLIYMSVLSDKNVSAKVFEKLSKFKDLQIELAKMWHMKMKSLPVVVGALGVIKKATEDYLNDTPDNPSLREVQKIVLTSTAHVLRRALSI